MDDLAWDLGNPDSAVSTSPIPINFGVLIPFLVVGKVGGIDTPINGSGVTTDFHPMKGPFTTQTLRGMRNSGAMHWRGDRSTGVYGTNPVDANVSFANFAPAFQSLLGNATMPAQSEMQTFADFQLQVLPPPNPVRNLDNSLNRSQANGFAFYAGARPSDGILSAGLSALVGQSSFSCNQCHELDPQAGHFGTSTNQSFEGVTQIVKIPQLRNAYAKIGMFGTPAAPFFSAADSGNMGDQVRGFGFMADGGTDTIFRFLTATVFNPTSDVGFPQSNPDGARRDVEQFLLAYDSDLAPIVGQQITLTSANAAVAGPRIALLLERAGTAFVSKSLNGTVTECDVVAQLVVNGVGKSYLYEPAMATFIGNRRAASLSDAQLRALAATPGQEITYTAWPPGSGQRVISANLPERRPPSPPTQPR
jgi:hypothetical protein